MENPSAKKASRIDDIEALLLSHPEGMTPAELARRLDVNRSTIGRYLPDLPKHIYIDDVDGGRWKIDRQAYLVNVRFSLHEALSVHLAARLLATRMDRHNPHAAAALRKLGIALEKLAPHISRHLGQSADMMDDETARSDPRYLQVLEGLTLAWAEGRKVRVWHRHEPSEQALAYTFSPYFIEPYAVGQSTHAIGLREPPGQLRTFKIERIERIEPLNESYSIPADFDPRVLLGDAWGIWYSETEPQLVVLRFHPRVAARIKETRWHRSEQIEEQPDGFLLWRAQVAEPREMLPWLRGWGGDVEVLAPETLREHLIQETKRLVQLYQLQPAGDTPVYFLLWAKTNSAGQPDTHALIYHLIDTAECALALWQTVLSAPLKARLANALGLDVAAAGRQVAFWTALHDLGKASPVFQRKYEPAIPALKQIGFTFPPESPAPVPHGILSAWALRDLLQKEGGLSPRDAKGIASALGGHHGAWPTNDWFNNPARIKLADRGDAPWDTARLELFRALSRVYRPSTEVRLPANQMERNAFLTLLSGLVSVADWIGSMAVVFQDTYLPAQEYAQRAAQQARQALEQLNWPAWPVSEQALGFADLFPFVAAPNAIQQQTAAMAASAGLPALLILEAPTGIGKTEAALLAADGWLQRQQGSGLYVAMPTQATSNQMHGRVVSYLKNRYPDLALNVFLVHGAALLAEEPPQPSDIHAEDGLQNVENAVKVQSWFLPRKRTLLTPFAVGTVDQALVSVLQTNHFFVRMLGLGHKVVIFDEVHAYDTYMSTLFERLLAWLRSIGASVILLSATLPERTRTALVRAWSGAGAPPAAYPRLTMASGGAVSTQSLPPPSGRTVRMVQIETSPERIAEHLDEKLRNGGCAAVICNRVGRAQAVYAAIQALSIVPAEHLVLFHARFPFAWRDAIEQQVLGWFQKGGERPEKAVVVATQVIEQSLDLDFDYLVSDIAPLDFLLQRAGRLHRHSGNDARRPEALRTPILAIAQPPLVDDLPDFGLDARVYDQAILLRSWQVLQGRAEMVLPAETSALIEAVYGDGDMGNIDPHFQAALRTAEEKARLAHEKEIVQAKQRLIARPDDEELIGDRNEGLEEEDARVHAAFRALTRLGEPGVSLICLHQTAQGLALEPDGTGAPVQLGGRPNRDQARDLLRRAVNVQRREVVDYFTTYGSIPAGWRVSAALRGYYPVEFDARGEFHPKDAGFYLRLSREFGLEVIKEEP